MTKTQKCILVLCLLVASWVLLFPTTRPVQSSSSYGITLTPIPTATATATVSAPKDKPTNTSVVPTLPIPPEKTGMLIPVTGASPSGGLVTFGLVIIALGLFGLGLSLRKN
jgi:hypothetical protein